MELDYIPLIDVEFVKLMQDIGEDRGGGGGGKGVHHGNSAEQARKRSAHGLAEASSR